MKGAAYEVRHLRDLGFGNSLETLNLGGVPLITLNRNHQSKNGGPLSDTL